MSGEGRNWPFDPSATPSTTLRATANSGQASLRIQGGILNFSCFCPLFHTIIGQQHAIYLNF